MNVPSKVRHEIPQPAFPASRQGDRLASSTVVFHSVKVYLACCIYLLDRSRNPSLSTSAILNCFSSHISSPNAVCPVQGTWDSNLPEGKACRLRRMIRGAGERADSLKGEGLEQLCRDNPVAL